MSALGDPIRAPLDKEILVWMREAEWKRDDARFRELALALFRHQFGHCTPYRRFCEARGVVPDAVSEWHEIPAVPAGAFKEVALRSFPKHLERGVILLPSGNAGQVLSITPPLTIEPDVLLAALDVVIAGVQGAAA